MIWEGFLVRHGVTLRHVLSHTSGFPSTNLKPGESLRLNFPPGEQFAYSGESFRYLGKVLEEVTGTSLARHMQEKVLTPLRMLHSSFVWESCYDSLAASPHNYHGDPLEKWRPRQAIASFSLHTTATDFARFMIASRSLTQMFEENAHINETLRWGLGWGIEKTVHGEPAYWYAGDNGAFQCLAFQNNHVGFVVMTNSPSGCRLYKTIFEHIDGGTHPLLDWELSSHEMIDDDLLRNWWKILSD